MRLQGDTLTTSSQYMYFSLSSNIGLHVGKRREHRYVNMRVTLIANNKCSFRLYEYLHSIPRKKRKQVHTLYVAAIRNNQELDISYKSSL